MQGNENGLPPWQAGIVGRITCFHERSNPQGIKNRDGAASLDASLVQIAAEQLELGKISHGGKRREISQQLIPSIGKSTIRRKKHSIANCANESVGNGNGYLIE